MEIRLTPIAQIGQLKQHWHRKSQRKRGSVGEVAEEKRTRESPVLLLWMAPYLVPKVINHSPAILPLGVFLHHNIADRRTVNITWSAHHEEGLHSYPVAREKKSRNCEPRKKNQVYTQDTFTLERDSSFVICTQVSRDTRSIVSFSFSQFDTVNRSKDSSEFFHV